MKQTDNELTDKRARTLGHRQREAEVQSQRYTNRDRDRQREKETGSSDTLELAHNRPLSRGQTFTNHYTGR